MSWAEVKKINDNMSIPLDQLFLKLVGGFHRDYIYESTTYEVPWDGVFTIRAYCGQTGAYGKVVKKFSKGERLTINIDNESTPHKIEITSNLQSSTVFHIDVMYNATVNSNSADSVRALAIGGAQANYTGGAAYVHSNNGIAAGGGGAGGTNGVGYAGGDAYASGNNCYAFGGGGGGGGNSGYNNGGAAGGAAYINGTQINTYCNISTFTSGKGYEGGNSFHTSAYTAGGAGGDGGCGGGAGMNRLARNTTETTWKIGGNGIFSDGGYLEGASARGGAMTNVYRHGAYSNNAASKADLSGRKGYFVGGKGEDAIYASNFSYSGGIGGFLGGDGGIGDYSNTSGGNGGYSPYGIGGKGGNSRGNNSNYASGKGGDGKLFGGNGGSANGNVNGGNGGNGYYPGKGGTSTNGISGSDGIAITNGVMTASFPLRGMTPTTSIVIIEAGDSIEDF